MYGALAGTWLLLYGTGLVTGGRLLGPGGTDHGSLLHDRWARWRCSPRDSLASVWMGLGFGGLHLRVRVPDRTEVRWLSTRTRAESITLPRRPRLRRSARYQGAASEALELDRVIHERMRLAIVSALAVNPSLSFNELKQLLDTTDGNLSVHARKLEDAGYVRCTKSFEGGRRAARTELTGSGRQALAALSRLTWRR